jgi:FKBP-type peptidyl-prolyl cis-trans isomerase SlyD
MSEDVTVEDGKVVTVHYVLKDGSGEKLDQSGDDPMLYLHGANNVVPGLENALLGKKAGDELEVEVTPEDAYGPKQGIKPQKILRSNFPEDVDVQVGTQFFTETPEGQPFPIWVTKVMGRDVYITPEHPLAGITLHFSVKIEEIRDATEEEIAHGHPHGPGGHHHHDDEG